MKYPKITVITPSYNQGEFLERTILSIINQNYPDLEYMICDGGSTDNSVEIIKKYEDKITWWCSEKDKGQTDAINKGMRRATGEIVCWINSDDVLLPDALHFVGQYFAKHNDVDFLMGVNLEIDKQDYILKQTHTILNHWMAIHGCYNVNQQSMFWRYSLFEKTGAFLDETYHARMDQEFLIRVFTTHAKMITVNVRLGAIRIYSETKTAQGGDIWNVDKKKIIDKYHAYVNKNPFVFFLYAGLKMLRGYYIQDILFKYRNRKNKVQFIKSN